MGPTSVSYHGPLVTLARSVLAAGLLDLPFSPSSADSRDMAQETGANGGKSGAPAENTDAIPVLQIVAQYVKDLSFENPSMGVNVQRPQIDFTVDLQARRLGDNAPYEVLLKLR